MGLDVPIVFVEQRLEVEPETAIARHVETEQVKQRQVAADRSAVRVFQSECIGLSVDDYERVYPQSAGVSQGVQGVESLLSP
jgi:hypothetical protein